MTMLRRSPTTVLVLLTAALLTTAVAHGEDSKDQPVGPHYRLVGPAAGGRVARVAGVIGDPLTYYAATAAGGVWKSVDGGLEWKPIFDDQPVSSIGSVAVSPSDENVVWVGSGEANIRGNVAEGNGIYRSTDGGETWHHVWTGEGQIGALAIDPRDPDTAFAAVLGSPFGPGSDRGVYRTVDGGVSWTKVLFVDNDTGASDVCLDPSNPRIVFAGMWQARRTPWSLTSGGPGSGLYLSRDGGDTWKRLYGKGLPDGIWGKIGVRVAPSDPERVYALIEAEEGGLFRSDDGGGTFTRVNASRGLRQRAWYYSTLTIDPTHADSVWFPQVSMLKSIDGGASIRSVKGGGWDYHDVWIDPADPRRMIVGSDAGISVSRDGGRTWTRPPVPIAQFYHLSVDTRTPYRVLGSLQDWGTVSGPSNSLHADGIFRTDWYPVGGGEAGWVVADPADPDIVWAGEYGGYLSRWDRRTSTAASVGILPDNPSGHPASDLKYRFQWTAPIVVSPHDHRVVYHAANVLFRTQDGGQHWTAISPDLTRNDPTKQAWSGGPITGDITGVETYDTIFAVAESPVEAGVIWAGSDDGLVHVTRDGGAAWTDVTPPGLPDWGTVECIEASRWDAGTAYVVVNAHRLDDERPFLWKTTDYGHSWSVRSAGLDPETALHVVREDARLRGMLYLGTERGVMVSRDDGGTWQSLCLNMPTVSVVDLAIAGDDLVVGTLGRSAWILDDLTPIREQSPSTAAEPVHLFPPTSAVRWRTAPAPSDQSAGAGDNPPRGAVLTYSLAAKPEGEISLEVLDAAGTLVRRLSSVLRPTYTAPDHPNWDPDSSPPKPELSTEPGLNRVAWDLAYQGPRWVVGTRMEGSAPPAGPLVPPGDYTLRLTVDDHTVVRPLRVEPDPRSDLAPEDLQAGVVFALKISDRLTAIADMVATTRDLRAQLTAINKRLTGDPDQADLVASSRDLVARLDAIEGTVHNPDADVDYDILAGRHGGVRLYSRLNSLFDAAKGHDGTPTQGMLEVDADLTSEMDAQTAALDELVSRELTRFNTMARDRGLPYVARGNGGATTTVGETASAK